MPGINFPEIDCVGWDDASPQHGFHCREQLSVNMRKTLLAWLNGKRLPDRGNSLAIYNARVSAGELYNLLTGGQVNAEVSMYKYGSIWQG